MAYQRYFSPMAESTTTSVLSRFWNRCKQCLVSDAGHPFSSVPTMQQWIVPRFRRIFEISAEQVAAVRKRWLVKEFVEGTRQGATWSISTRLSDFPMKDALGYDEKLRKLFSKARTDLNAFSEGEIACLENHGYSLADAGMRSRAAALCPNINRPFAWPHNNWSDNKLAESAMADSQERHLIRDVFRYLFSFRAVNHRNNQVIPYPPSAEISWRNHLEVFD